ncbi:transposable element Tcb2 transposase [Trichonephila clavipes]|nr:transposable element Tcb2 transposase [Trichonephila clavipes]
MPFTRRSGLGRPRQTSRREDRHIVRNARVQTTASSAAIQTMVAPSLGVLCLLETYEGAYRKDIWDRSAHSDVFSDESIFNLSSDANCVRFWRPRGKRLNPAFALQRHTTPTTNAMVWVAITYDTRSPLVLIRGTKTAQRYFDDVLQPHVFPLMQRLPGASFQQDNARPHTAKVLQDFLRTVTTLSWAARSPDLSPIEHIWDYLG